MRKDCVIRSLSYLKPKSIEQGLYILVLPTGL